MQKIPTLKCRVVLIAGQLKRGYQAEEQNMPLQGIVNINSQQIDQTLKVFINNNGWGKGLDLNVTNCVYTSLWQFVSTSHLSTRLTPLT